MPTNSTGEAADVRGAARLRYAWALSLAAVAFAASLAFLAARIVSRLDVPGEPEGVAALMDFRDAVYFPAAALVAGDNPYDAPAFTAKYPVANRFPIYTPLALELHAPFALLPYRVGQVVYVLVGVALLLALTAWSLHICGVRLTAPRLLAVAAFVLASRPGNWNAWLGQVSLQAAIPVCLAVWYARARPSLAAFALAVATFKPTYAVPVALVLLVRGDYRVIAKAIAIAVALTLPALIILACADGVGPLVSSLLATAGSSAAVHFEPALQSWHHPLQKTTRIDLVSFALRLTGTPPQPALSAALMLAVLAFAAAGMHHLRRRNDPGARLLGLELTVLAMLVCSYHQLYDLVVLTPLLVALAGRGDLEPWAGRPALRWGALGLALIPFVNYLASFTFWSAFPDRPLLRQAPGDVNTMAVLAVLVICGVLALRMPRAPST